MAFQQPAAYARKRHFSVAEDQPDLHPPVNREPLVEPSQEWVLFGPAAALSTRTCTDSLEFRSPTAVLSRVSDLGSPYSTIEQVAEPAAGSLQVLSGRCSIFKEEEDGLDSLDSHLHAFHEPSSYLFLHQEEHNAAAILPTHDGLGSFLARNETDQEHLCYLEPHVPQPPRQISSVRSAAVARQDEELEVGRHARIEAWRLEQSKILVERIGKETRKRETSTVSEKNSKAARPKRRTTPFFRARDVNHKSKTSQSVEKTGLFLENENDLDHSEDTEMKEPFWKRITRHVIRDIIGIDEPLLSIIMGETLPDDHDPTRPDVLAFNEALENVGQEDLAASRGGWEERLLEQIAHELGQLVYRISKHPGAFSTYLRTQHTPGYVGCTTPAADKALLTPVITSRASPDVKTQHKNPVDLTNGATQFFPSISPELVHEPLSLSLALDPSPISKIETERLRIEREYWERELDVSMVFNFLRNRFSRRRPSSPSPHPVRTSLAHSRSHSSTAAARATTIRQQHPLVSLTRPNDKKSSSRPVATASFLSSSSLKRPGTTCGSESAQSKRARGGRGGGGASSIDSTTTNTHTSRNYWDLGGESVGSNSLVAATGVFGAWGAV